MEEQLELDFLQHTAKWIYITWENSDYYIYPEGIKCGWERYHIDRTILPVFRLFLKYNVRKVWVDNQWYSLREWISSRTYRQDKYTETQLVETVRKGRLED